MPYVCRDCENYKEFKVQCIRQGFIEKEESGDCKVDPSGKIDWESFDVDSSDELGELESVKRAVEGKVQCESCWNDAEKVSQHQYEQFKKEVDENGDK